MTSPSKILFHGTGAIGTIYAYQLDKAGCDVTTICRSNYTAAKQNGFHIDSDLYGNDIHFQPKVVKTPEEAAQDGPYDYLLVSCKALPEAKTAETIASAVTPGHTTIVLVQNGIDIEQEYADRFPSNPLLSCVVYLPATQTSPGHIRMAGLERLEIGAYPSTATATSPAVQTSVTTLISLLQSGGGNPISHPNIQELRWFKLLLNAPWNPICALTLSRDRAFLASSPFAEPVINGVLNEVIAISHALGYKSVTREAADRGLAVIKGRSGTPGIEPSMLVDVLCTRRTEHEVILGNPVRIARELGVQVPRMEMLYAMVKALDLAQEKRKEGRSLDCGDLGVEEV